MSAAATYFHGHEHNECGEHRTVGPHRAWCHADSEWCYPNLPCRGCELPRLRTALADLSGAFDRMPDAGLTDSDPRFHWWNETADVRRRAREVLS